MRPRRETIRNKDDAYFVSTQTAGRKPFFRHERWARLMLDVLKHYDGTGYTLHAFVIMPDHFHLLISPLTSLEKALQLVKGGFSFRAKKELDSNAEIWQRGFSDHRIRDWEDFEKHMHYVHLNPVKRRLCERPEEYKFSSAFPGWKLDPIPQWLKPEAGAVANGTAEAVPLQNRFAEGGKR